MSPLSRGSEIDRPARNAAADLVAAIRRGEVSWEHVPSRLTRHRGRDRVVAAVERELLSASSAFRDRTPDPEGEGAVQLDDFLARIERFLRSDLPYRWHDAGPVQIVGAYLGVSGFSWCVVGLAGLLLGFKNLIVAWGTIIATFLMVAMSIAMGIALIWRLVWRIKAGREGAQRAAWPYFTMAEAGGGGEGGAAGGDEASDQP